MLHSQGYCLSHLPTTEAGKVAPSSAPPFPRCPQTPSIIQPEAGGTLLPPRMQHGVGGRGRLLDPVEAWSSPEARVAGAGGGVPACLGRTAVQQEAGKGSGRRCFPWEEDAFQARLHDARLGADLTPLEDLGAVLSLSATSGSSRGTRPRGMLPQCPLLSDLLIAFHSGYTACGCARPHACAFGCVVGVRVSGQYTGPPPPSAQSPESATCHLLCSHSAHLQQLRED